MKKKIIFTIVCAVLLCCVLAACGENTNQNAIPTVAGDVSDNGGMAVSYGDYVYFINGFAGESADNTFGEVVRGSICRVTLKDGTPDYTTVTTIVPKNVFGEDTTYGGLYIVGDYIYYNTTSVDKDSELNYKSSQGVLCRTKVDGSVTETIKELDDNDIKLYAGDNSKYLVYAYDNYLYSINSETLAITTLTKSTAESNEDVTAVAHTFVGDYAIFTTYNYADATNYSTDYIVYVYNLVNGQLKAVLSSDIYNGDTDRDILYTTTVTSVAIDGDKLTLFYKKDDNTQNGANDGFYSYTFGADLAYDATKELRYSYETSTTTYSAFYTLDNGYVLAFSGKAIDVFQNGTKVEKASYDAVEESKYLSFDFGADSITVIDVVETASEVYINYIANSTFCYIKLFNKTTEGSIVTYAYADENKIDFFKGVYNSSYVTYDIIGNVIYYLNDDMEDNAYYYVIPALDTITADTDITKGKILGIISEDDLLTLIGEGTTDSEDDGHDHEGHNH